MAHEIFTVRIEGLAETQAALRQLPDATAKTVMRRILTTRAKPIAAAAEARAPVRRGKLKKSVRVGARLSRRQRAQHRKADPSDVEVFVGPGPLPHAHLQEFGSRRHGAQQYLTPAWEQNVNALLANIREDLWSEIARAADRLAAKARRAAST